MQGEGAAGQSAPAWSTSAGSAAPAPSPPSETPKHAGSGGGSRPVIQDPPASGGSSGSSSGGAGASVDRRDASPPEPDADAPDAAAPDPFADAALPPLFPEPSTPDNRPPSPDNPTECPSEAPADPWGPCVGLPVYLECNYGTYFCICDWIHWICVG
jgi:hypothetical protein